MRAAYLPPIGADSATPGRGAIPHRRGTRHLRGMARSHVRHRHDLPTLRAPPPDLYDYAAPPTRRLGRPLKHDLADWRVVDD